MRRRHSLCIAFAALAAACSVAQAQAPSADAAKYPEQLVRLVVPFSAGSMTDLLGRVIVDKLSERWKQQVIVENRPGLAGTSSVAKATADGYTLMLTSNGHTVIGNLNKNLSFDPQKDFVGISQVATTPLILVAPPESATKIGQGADRGRQGQAGRAQLQLRRPRQHHRHRRRAVQADDADRYRPPPLPRPAGVPDRRHPRRRGHGLHVLQRRRRSRPERQDARRWPSPAPSGSPACPMCRPSRRPACPNSEYDAWFGVMAPAATPKPIVAKVAEAIAAVLQMPDVKARFEPQGVELKSSPPDTFDAVIRSDAERYGKIIKPPAN